MSTLLMTVSKFSKAVTLIAVISSLMLLSACGQKGGLYLPQDKSVPLSEQSAVSGDKDDQGSKAAPDES
jgi:predicted small lipoprotein YifL